MKNQILLVLLLSFIGFVGAQHTFSIIAIDSVTGEIGAAGASCIDGAADIGGVQIISQIIPGRGGINAQAQICIPNRNLDRGIERLSLGDSPDEVLEYLYENDACFWGGYDSTHRQYGVVDIDSIGRPRAQAFTGAQCMDWAGHIVGSNYAIQGNILIDSSVIEKMEEGFLNSTGTLADKLMAAMQGANIEGADSRCLDRGTSSTSIFLKVYGTDDHVDTPSIGFNIMEMPYGEEPIDSLQNLFNLYMDSLKNVDSISAVLSLEKQVMIFPNPVADILRVQIASGSNIDRVIIRDILGKVMTIQELNLGTNDIFSADWPSGVYHLEFRDKNHIVGSKRILK